MKGSGYLGVIPGQTEKMYSTWSGAYCGCGDYWAIVYETIKGVGVLLVKTVHGSIGQIFGSAESKESARADFGLCQRERSRTNWHTGRIFRQLSVLELIYHFRGGVNLADASSDEHFTNSSA